jgi:hypothetical protein
MQGWIILITCGKSKATRPCAAKDLYIGNAFRSNWRWASSVFPENQIYIISAKFGLLRASQIIPPYELKMGSPGSVNASLIQCQAIALGIDQRRVCFIGGDTYFDIAKTVWSDIRHPTKGLTLGRKAQLLKKNIGKFPYKS